jgi:hypothetical protein
MRRLRTIEFERSEVETIARRKGSAKTAAEKRLKAPQKKTAAALAAAVEFD